jgi:hypothetical protein
MMTDAQVAEVRDLTRKAHIKATTTRLRPGDPLISTLAPGKRSLATPEQIAELTGQTSRADSAEARIPGQSTGGKPHRNRGGRKKPAAAAAAPEAGRGGQPARSGGGQPRSGGGQPRNGGQPRTGGAAAASRNFRGRGASTR